MSVVRTVGRWAGRVALVLLAAVIAVVVWAQFSPRPAVFAINWAFSLTDTGEVTESGPIQGVEGQTDLPYGTSRDEVLDVWSPTESDGPMPVVVWVHGGGWIGGSKSQPAPYLRLLAQEGYVGIGINYSLAPDHQYPVPVRQTGEALQWIQDHADELGIDPDRIVLAGDSAGAHIAAQYAALVTDAEYAAEVGVEPTIEPSQLRGVLLHCGPYDPPMAATSTGIGGWFVRQIAWAYIGTKDFDDLRVEQASIVRHATEAYPRALISGGDDDPLTAQGRALADRLGELGVRREAFFYPGLNHEFQFDLRLDESREVLDATKDFLAEVTAPTR